MFIDTNPFTILQSGWNNGVKLWTFYECSEAFQDKVPPDIDFINEVVIQCAVLDVKTLF